MQPIFFNFNEPYFGNIYLTQLLLWLNYQLGMCWHGRARIHPNINVSQDAICTICRGWMAASSERQYSFLSADEIFCNYNELFFRNVSFNIVSSWHISKTKIQYAPWSRCFHERQMHKLPRGVGLGGPPVASGEKWHPYKYTYKRYAARCYV